MASNLPPGCTSPDGGIDHEFEQAVENLAEAAETTEVLKALLLVTPVLKDLLMDAWSNGRREGYEQAGIEADARDGS